LQLALGGAFLSGSLVSIRRAAGEGGKLGLGQEALLLIVVGCLLFESFAWDGPLPTIALTVLLPLIPLIGLKLDNPGLGRRLTVVWRALINLWLASCLCSVVVIASNFDTLWSWGWVYQARSAPGGQFEVYVRIAAVLQALVGVATFLVSQRFVTIGGTLNGNAFTKILRTVAASAVGLVPLMVVYWAVREDFSGVARAAVDARVLLARQMYMRDEDASDSPAEISADLAVLENLLRSRPLGRSTPISEIIAATSKDFDEFYIRPWNDPSPRPDFWGFLAKLRDLSIKPQASGRDLPRFRAGRTSLGGAAQKRYEDVMNGVEYLIKLDYDYHIVDRSPGKSSGTPVGTITHRRSTPRDPTLQYVKSSIAYYDSPAATWWRLIDYDQKARLQVIVIAFFVFLGSGLLVNLNRTSIHDFYRDRLSDAFLYEPGEGGDRRDIEMQDLEASTRSGYPYHLVSATLNLPYHPTEQGHESRNFLFSSLYCGSSVTGYRLTKDYRWSGGETVKLADAMAISGAAISPAQAGSFFNALMLSLLNWRLGQWARNPRSGPGWGRRLLWRPNLLTILASNVLQWLRSLQGSDSGSWKGRDPVFLSDGAHYDNLGLELLLERRCKMMIVSDVSNDARFEMADLLSVLRRARERWGIEFFACKPNGSADYETPMEEQLARWVTTQSLPRRRRWKSFLGLLRSEPTAAGPSEPDHPVFCGYVRYPAEKGKAERQTATLFLIKPNYWGLDKWPMAVKKYFELHQDFPHEPNIDQFFTQNQAEAYRQLGFVIGLRLDPVPGPESPWAGDGSWIDVGDVAEKMIRKVMTSDMKPPASKIES